MRTVYGASNQEALEELRVIHLKFSLNILTWKTAGLFTGINSEYAVVAKEWPQHSEERISSVQSLSRVRLFATPWTAALQASLSITNSQSLLKPTSIESVMPSSHLILYRPLLLLPSTFPSIRVFSSESVLIRRPKYWSFSFSISPSSEYSGLFSFRTDWFDLFAV